MEQEKQEKAKAGAATKAAAKFAAIDNSGDNAMILKNEAVRKAAERFEKSKEESGGGAAANSPPGQQADIFALNHKSSIFRSVMQPCMWFLHDGTG